MNFIKNKVNNFTDTVGKRTEIDEITTMALIFQRIYGQHVLDPKWTWKRCHLYYSLSLFMYIYVIFGTLEVFKNTPDNEMIAEASYTIILIIIFPTKLMLFINNRDLFRELYVIIKTTLLDTIKQDSNFEKVMKTAKNIVHLLFAMVIIPVTNIQLTNLWNYMNGNRIPLSRSTSTLMPTTSPFHELAWLLHSIFLFQMSTTIILDMWFVLLIYFLCAANDGLVKILEVKRRDDETDLAYGKRLNDSLRRFYVEHVKHIQFINLLNKMYKWLAIVPLCNAAMCICIVLHLLSKEINWKFVPHVLPMFAEIFAYNWFGEQIKTKAANTNSALLNFDWTDLEMKDRKSYYVIISYMTKEFSIKTAVGNDLSLITMTAVLKASYQAFTVLQSMGE